MKKARHRFGWGVAIATLVFLGGCGSGAPPASSSKTTAQVKGRVTLQGKPLKDVEVQFNPSNINRPTAAKVTTKVGADGNYEITTLVGENVVTLGGSGVGNNPQVQYFSKMLDVQGGTNSFDIAIP
jgi:hypothetical protein